MTDIKENVCLEDDFSIINNCIVNNNQRLKGTGGLTFDLHFPIQRTIIKYSNSNEWINSY